MELLKRDVLQILRRARKMTIDSEAPDSTPPTLPAANHPEPKGVSSDPE